MYSIGHTFIHELYQAEFKVVKVFEQYKMYLCETVKPEKDEHGMDIRLFTYHSEDYIHERNDYK